MTIYVCIGIHKYVYAKNVFNVSIFFMKIICQKNFEKVFTIFYEHPFSSIFTIRIKFLRYFL